MNGVLGDGPWCPWLLDPQLSEVCWGQYRLGHATVFSKYAVLVVVDGDDDDDDESPISLSQRSGRGRKTGHRNKKNVPGTKRKHTWCVKVPFVPLGTKPAMLQHTV